MKRIFQQALLLTILTISLAPYVEAEASSSAARSFCFRNGEMIPCPADGD